jgi:hypothetical protein
VALGQCIHTARLPPGSSRRVAEGATAAYRKDCDRALGRLVEDLAPPWLAQQESRLRVRRGRDRLRAEGAGPGRELPFADRVIVTLVILRFQHRAPVVAAGQVCMRRSADPNPPDVGAMKAG